MTRTLLVGPWVGEFGFEVALWAPHARRVARDYDHVTVACEPGHEALYGDFADEFELFPVPDDVVVRDCEYGHTTTALGSSAPKLELPPLRVADHWLHPYRLRKTMTWEWGSMPYMPEGTFEVRGLGEQPKPERGRPHLVFHARNDHKQSIKAWPIEKWDELSIRLNEAAKVCVGSIMGAHSVARTEDLIGKPISQVAGFMFMADLVVGSASGPMALAMHSGTPCVWWADTSQNAHLLYEQSGPVAACWNPHGVKHYRAADTWDPSVDQVFAAVEEALA